MNDDFDNAQTDREALEAFDTAVLQREQIRQLDVRHALSTLPARRPSRPCLTCTLPETLRHVIEEDRASAKPHSFEQLSRFLRTQGIDLSAAAIAGHFRKGHV